jgi:hypothetical protein
VSLDSLDEGSPNTRDDLSKIKHWDNCEGTLIFNSADKYVGEFKDGVADGKGTYTWASGNKYVGSNPTYGICVYVLD